MLKPMLKHRFSNHARAVRDGEQRHERSLQIRRKSRKWRRLHISAISPLAERRTVSPLLVCRSSTPASWSTCAAAPSISSRPYSRKMSPSVMAAAHTIVPSSMRSGITLCSAAPSVRRPSTVSASLPIPAMLAPMALRQFPRSATSGSRAALRMTVLPFARTAARSRFSVAPTEG
jgi:hypothetical protein